MEYNKQESNLITSIFMKNSLENDDSLNRDDPGKRINSIYD